MKFGQVPPAEAAGAILAHSVHLSGRRLQKGRRLDAADCAALAAAGLAGVTVARLEQGDIHEDAAADRLARALVAGSDLGLTRPHTGRVNVLAPGPGLARVDTAAIHALNRVEPMITVATVPPWQRLAAGGLVATIKIISYAVADTALAAATAPGQGALGFASPRIGTAALIETRVHGSPVGKGLAAIRTRLDRLGAGLSGHAVVDHDEAALAAAILACDAELILLLTASATSDIRDVAPAAVVRAGGRVAHFGMPVDPGNLLFLGDIGGRPVVGLPGCARSPALNGADWVLERMICGVPVTAETIAAMGVGGLLKEAPGRPHPRRG